jgi:hypothetical protein
MIIKNIILVSALLTVFASFNIRYHELVFTTSDPEIIRRCVDIREIDTINNGFVRETYDSDGRCRKLEFFEKSKKPYESTDFPSVIQYVWTDSSLIETLYQRDGKLFSEEEYILPNRSEYIICKSKVIKMKDFFDDELVNTTYFNHVNIEEADLFMMYSGCEIKYNSHYKVKF